MLSMSTLFWMMIVFFGLIGMLRGWTKEIVATSGLVLSLFTQLWFGGILVGLFSSSAAGMSEDVMRSNFYVRAITHIVFAFFSYQGPTVMRTVSRGRFGERARSNIEEAILGFVVGAVNGYLIVGTLWSFLECFIASKDSVICNPLGYYPFSADIISRPLEGTPAYALLDKLPFPMLQGWLPLLMVVLFLFVIIAMI